MTASEEKSKRNKRQAVKYDDQPCRAIWQPPPPTLCAQLCCICQWRVGDAAGEKLSEWELNDTWQNKAVAMALLCRDSLLHKRSAVGEGRLESKWSCVTCPLPAKDTRASMVSIKKKNTGKNFKFPVQSPDRRDHTPSLKPGLTQVLQQIVVSAFPQLQYLFIDSHVGHPPGPQLQPLCRDSHWWHSCISVSSAVCFE